MPTEDKTIIADSASMVNLAPQKKKQACLIQYSGSNLGKRYNLEKTEVSIGRIASADFFVNEQSISKQHARFTQIGDTYQILDLGSTNGTYINDEKIRGVTVLNNEDLIRLGTVLFKFYSHISADNIFADKIYGMATIDAGTNIFNKKYLLEELDNQFKLARSSAFPLSVIYFDLDHFKKVNDIHGHNCGDFILKETAALIKAITRGDDIFARFGGEEFVILLPQTENSVAVDLAERIRRELEGHNFYFEGKDLKQTISLGVTTLNQNHIDPKAFLDDADKKLYQSKEGGRNRVTS